MKKLILFTILLFAFNAAGYCQNSKLDSLLTALSSNKINDTNKIKTYNAICWEYFITSDYKKSREYADLSIQLCDQLNFLKGKAEAINYIGNIHAQKSEYNEALIRYKQSLEIKKQINDIKGIGATYNNIGNVLWNQGNLPEALKNHLEALKIREQIGNPKNIAQSYANISNIHLSQKNYDEALKYSFKALEMQEKNEDKFSLGITHNNIGTIYESQGNYKKALEHHLLSQKYKEEIGDKYGIALSHFNIGLLQIRQGENDLAEENLLKSLKISEEIEDIQNLSRIYNQLANIEAAKKNYRKVKDYQQKAFDYAIKTNSKELIRDAYWSKCNIAFITKDWEQAFNNYKSYIVYRDSIANEESNKTIVQQQMQYEFDKKEALAKTEQAKKDEIAAKEQQKQQIVLYSTSGGLFLVIILAGLIFKNLQTNKKKNKIISHQKQLVEEKQKEIIDSIHYAKRIQHSLLPTEKYIEKSLNRLKNDIN